MKLKIPNEEILIHDIEQDSDEWLMDFRPKGVGSSDIILLFEPNGSFDRNVFGFWKDRLGYEKFNTVSNEHIKRGKALEPFIRDEVNKILGTSYEPLCVSRKSKPYLRASLDGYDEATDSILEIKAPAQKMFEKMVNEGIPKYYYYQIQYQLLVMGAEYARYAFYNEQNPTPYILTVENNLELQMEIEKRCDLFWESIQSKTPIGFANSELKLFPVRPSIILADSNYQENLLENINAPRKVSGSIVFVNPSPKDVTEMRRLNPNHEVVDLIDY